MHIIILVLKKYRFFLFIIQNIILYAYIMLKYIILNYIFITTYNYIFISITNLKD